MMKKIVLLLFLLSFLQQNVDGCKKSCKPKRLKCPIGIGSYEIDTFEQLSTCWVINGEHIIHDLIARNCWWEDVAEAKKCLKKESDGCSDPTAFKPSTVAHFSAACHGHDACYGCKLVPSWDVEKKQKWCDDVFHDNMETMCDGGSWYLFGGEWLSCQAQAGIAYAGVRAKGNHRNGGCWLEGINITGKKRKRRDLDNSTNENSLPVARNVEKAILAEAKRRQMDKSFDMDKMYTEFQGSCWDQFGHNTDKIWNETQSLINMCKMKRNKKLSMKCWRKIGKNLRNELESKKSSLIDCIDIESTSSKRINIDTIIKKDIPTREDNLMLKRIDLWNKAKTNETHLIDLEDEAIDIIENTLEQNEREWKKCWKKSRKIAKLKGVEMAEKKIKSCWKLKMDGKLQDKLSIST